MASPTQSRTSIALLLTLFFFFGFVLHNVRFPEEARDELPITTILKTITTKDKTAADVLAILDAISVQYVDRIMLNLLWVEC